MADIVQFLVTVQDMATGPLQKIAQTGEQAFAKIQQAVQKLSGKAEDLKKSLKNVNDQLDKLEHTRAINIDDAQIRKISKEMDNLLSKKSKLEKSAGGGGVSGQSGSSGKKSSMGNGLSKLADFGMDALVSGGQYALKAGMQRSADLTALQMRLGNAAGSQVSEGLEGMAKSGVYGDGVFDAGKQLAGSGVGAKNLVPAMHMIGDIAMGDGNNFQALTAAYSGASSAGHLDTEQASTMKNAGFDPLKALHESTGKSLPQLQADLAQGKISIDDLTKSMQFATGPAGHYHDAMKKVEQSPSGQLNEFNATVNSLAGSIGEALLPVLSAVARVFTALMEFTPLLYALGAAIGVVTIALTIYSAATKIATIWAELMNLTIAWPIVIIAVVIGLITFLITKFDGWGKSIKALWAIIKSFADMVIVSFKELVQELVFGFELIWLKAKSTFEHIVAFIINTKKAMMLALHGDFEGAGKALTANIKTEADFKITSLEQKRKEDLAANNKRFATDIANIKHSWNDVGLHTAKDAKSDNPAAKLMPSASPGGGVTGSEEGMGVSKAVANPPSAGTASSISGGGARNITINVAKFQDKTEIHTVGLKEGVKEVEDIIRDMFLRITGSATSMVTAGGE